MYIQPYNIVSSQAIILTSSRFCKGLLLVYKVAKDYTLSALPYLVLNGQDDPIKRITDFYLSCLQQEGSKLANLYLNVPIGFHITFYKRVEKDLLNSYAKQKKVETWKVGYLYKKSGALNNTDRLFRQSAFTIGLRLLRQHTNTYIRQVLATSKCLKGELVVN